MKKPLPFRLRSCWTILVLGLALPAEAQSTADNLGPRWTAEVTSGVMVEPTQGGDAGGAVAISLGRAPSRSMWSPSILVAASRMGNVARASNRINGYVVDRDWVVTAVCADAFVIRNERFVLSLGAKGGVLWNHDRSTEIAPAHPFGTQGSFWEQNVGLIIDGAAQYRVGQHVSVASRLGGVTHIFTDNMIGSTGLLASLGLAFGW